MEILNLGGTAESNAPATKSRKKFRVLLGIGALAAVTGIGSTLAANISLNGGGNVEFGQGVATTAACDDNITITPVSTFSNTEEDPTFEMTSIQVSGIDLTPEGFDVNAQEFDSEFNRESHTWTAGNEQHAGKYKNSAGDWVNTCENKVLLLRAFTDNSEFAAHTAGNSTSTPLFLTGWNYHTGNYYNGGSNIGIGFRIRHQSDTQDPGYMFWDVAADDSYNPTDDPLDITVNLGGSFNNDSSVTLFLDNYDVNPPSDSRWVDKITAESVASIPESWEAYYNW